jgi:hypothetical protein
LKKEIEKKKGEKTPSTTNRAISITTCHPNKKKTL